MAETTWQDICEWFGVTIPEDNDTIDAIELVFRGAEHRHDTHQDLDEWRLGVPFVAAADTPGAASAANKNAPAPPPYPAIQTIMLRLASHLNQTVDSTLTANEPEGGVVYSTVRQVDQATSDLVEALDMWKDQFAAPASVGNNGALADD
jgi:hypothetical protein